MVKKITLSMTVTPGSDFQKEVGVEALRAFARAFEIQFQHQHKSNKVEFFIEH